MHKEWKERQKFVKIPIRSELIPSKTRLKCKPCHEFYDDDVPVCKKCGGDLKTIKVYSLMPRNLTIHTNTSQTGGK